MDSMGIYHSGRTRPLLEIGTHHAVVTGGVRLRWYSRRGATERDGSGGLNDGLALWQSRCAANCPPLAALNRLKLGETVRDAVAAFVEGCARWFRWPDLPGRATVRAHCLRSLDDGTRGLAPKTSRQRAPISLRRLSSKPHGPKQKSAWKPGWWRHGGDTVHPEDAIRLASSRNQLILLVPQR
jgi:hypothetical protein